MSNLRILCTADLHIGRSSALIGEISGVDCSAKGAWRRIVELAISEDADAVAIAGDLFDGRAGYLEGRRDFLDGCERLNSHAIPVVAVSGNHDHDVLPLFVASAPAGFHFLGNRGKWEFKSIETRSGPASFVGWSFPAESVRESHLKHLERRDSASVVIGLVHGEVIPSSIYHPISVPEMSAKADVWIVGHIHKPHSLDPRIVYPGSPQALDFGVGERGQHGVRWLTINGLEANFSEIVPLSTVRYETVQLTVSADVGTPGLDAVLSAAQQLCVELEGRQTYESIQLRAEVDILGEENFDKWEMTDHQISERHWVQFTRFRNKKPLDPWSLTVLHSQAGEAARLLLGVRTIAGEETSELVNPSWVDSANRLLRQCSTEIAQQFTRTVGNIGERGESGTAPPDEGTLIELSYRWLTEELEAMLVEENK